MSVPPEAEQYGRDRWWANLDDVRSRAIAGILSELAEAGLARQMVEGNALTFQLSHPDHLRELLAAHDLGFPPWRKIVLAVLSFLDLASLENASAAVRRVEAHKRREELRRLADGLWLDTPPVTRGAPDAWEELMAWATRIAGELSAGTSPALGVLEVRAAAVEGGGEVWVWLHRSAADHERLAETLRQPQRAAAGIACTTVSPTADGWTSYQLALEPCLDEVEVRDKVERLVWPMKVAWRRVRPA